MVNNDGLVNLSLLKIQSAPLGNLRDQAFDGDEMNIFVPQSIQTQIELEEIANVALQIISPSTSRTSIGIVQDGLISAYNLTSPTMRIDWRNAMNIISYTTFDSFSDLKKNKKYTGHEIFSLIIPPGITVNKGGIRISNSQMTEGRLSKESLGEKKNFALHQLIWDEYGWGKTNEFINNTQKLTNNFNLYNGFTVGYGDACIDESVRKDIINFYAIKEQKIATMIAEVENNPNLLDYDVFEHKLFQEVNTTLSDTSKLVVANLKPDNNFNIIISCGAKGSSANIGMIAGSIGLQAIEGVLAPKIYNNRTLPYFHQNDDRGKARGLIRESYMEGLKFESFVFLLMAGREGLIDQSIRTADSGYAQRRLVKSQEDVMVCYDNTVRTVNNILLQIAYGDSGSDATKQYELYISMAEMDNAKLELTHKFSDAELKEVGFSSEQNNKLFNEIKFMCDEYRHLMMKSKSDFKTLTTKVNFPLNFSRIMDSNINNPKNKNGEKLTAPYIIETLETILQNKHTMLLAMSKQDQANKNSIKNKDEIIFKTFFRVALYELLSPKRVCIERKLNKTQFDAVIKEVKSTYNKSIVEAGEMVGIISSQALGEPLTQMTLNSFHLAGVKSMSQTINGTARVKEILSVSKNIKTPQMIIQLLPEFRKSKEMAHKVASNLKYTTLGDVRSRINIYYDPDPYEKGSLIEADGIGTPYSNIKTNKNSCQSDIKGLHWLMQIEIAKEKMLEKEVSLLDIKSKFCSWWEKRITDNKTLKKEEKRVINKITNIAIQSNSDNDPNPMLHIRFNVRDVDKNKDSFNREMLNEFIEHIIDKFKLKGFDGIENVPYVLPERMITYDEKSGEVKTDEQYIIYTKGLNLIDIRYLYGIDLTKVICNDIVQVYKTFGIEVARARLMRELYDAYAGGGAPISYTNLTVLVDVMTYGGILMSIDRHGMGKSDTDVLGRASFEKAVEQILTASVFGEVDRFRGVSSRIMGGMVIKGGTGLCDVVVDLDMIEKSEYTEENKYQKFTELITGTVAKDIVSSNVEDIFVPM